MALSREKRAARDDYFRHACCGSEPPVTASKHEKTEGNSAVTARGKSTMGDATLSDSDKSTRVRDNVWSLSKMNDRKLQSRAMHQCRGNFGIRDTFELRCIRNRRKERREFPLIIWIISDPTFGAAGKLIGFIAKLIDEHNSEAQRGDSRWISD